MKKNIKRYLSYVLGVILAMGLGLSYAYAVGANDSNAFVTTTEWETKVAQIEASLDNVTKTINDTNMDFVMNGPRLQSNMIDAYETTISMRGSDGRFSNSPWHYTSITGVDNIYPKFNDIYLRDRYNGTQYITNVWWSSSNTSATTYAPCFRYALRTTTPNYYLVATHYNNYLVTFHYVIKGGPYPISSSIPAQTLTVEYNRSQWGSSTNTNEVPTDVGRIYITNGWAGTGGWANYLNDQNANIDGYTISPIYLQRSVTDDKVTLTLEFPANAYSIRLNAAWDICRYIPYDLGSRGIKMGNAGDQVLLGPNGNNGAYIAEVYSPIKGCMCLKTYLNGEIPILN